MKMRFGHVTNSSSSSFIISKDDISRGKLLEVLLEIANTEAEAYGDEPFTWDDVTGTCVTFKYMIKEGTVDEPYTKYDIYDEKEYKNHYIIDNESLSRYDWDAVEDVLNKYDIPWEYGYCD